MPPAFQTILGLEKDGELLGAGIASHDSRKGWINRLMVDRKQRRQGFGKRLVTAAEAVLRDQGIEVIAAFVEGDNLASLTLFRELHYVEVDPDVHYLSKRESDEA